MQMTIGMVNSAKRLTDYGTIYRYPGSNSDRRAANEALSDCTRNPRSSAEGVGFAGVITTRSPEREATCKIGDGFSKVRYYR
jgi:hypothetical protein